MTVTRDALKGWARPANAAEWTEMLSGSGIANPNHAWPCTEASGNLVDVIAGTLTLTAGATPLYAQAATGWTGTGVAGNSANDRFVAAITVGPTPVSSSQVWMFTVSIQTEPTGAQVLGGIHTTSSVDGCRLQFNPAAGTNKLRINCDGVSTDGAIDHPVGSYVFTLQYDRAASAAKVFSDLETVAGTYSAAVEDGNKGFGSGSTLTDFVCLGIALWHGANAETLDAADIAAIRTRIETPEVAAPAVDPPGTTLAALQAGGGSWKAVAAIEGYPYLLTDGPPAAVLEAWTGLDWTEDPLAGLVWSDHEMEQRISPWDPLGSGGGRLRLVKLPDSPTPTLDTFGIDTHRADAGDETMLNGSVDKSATTLPVLATADFASSGTVYVGTEAVGYSGKTGTTLTGCTRGMWSPFTVDGGSTSRFGQKHEVLADSNEVPIAALVTERMRPVTLLGKWLGLWLHRFDEQNSLLNTRDDAQLIYPGRIVQVDDDPSTMGTVLECEHLLDYVKRAVIGEDMWSANIKEGMYLAAGMTFAMRDTADSGATWKDATSLMVIVGAAGANQIEPGFYTLSEIHTRINQWLVAELVATRIYGTYHIGVAPHDNNGPRTYFSYRIPGAGAQVAFLLNYPERVSVFFGNLQSGFASGGIASLHPHPGDNEDDTDYDFVGTRVPLRNMISDDSYLGPDSLPRIQLTDERGTFSDQAGSLPSGYSPPGYTGELGLFLIGDEYIAYGVKDGSEIRTIMPSPVRYAGVEVRGNPSLKGMDRTIEDEDDPVRIKQILIQQTTFALFLKQLFYSTGTAGYNHAVYDVLPAAMGLAIPGSLLGQMFEDSIDALPGANNPTTIIIDEPVKLTDLINGMLIFRWAFLYWEDESLRFGSWKTPITGTLLSEANKASPAGVEDSHRSASVLTDEWQRQYIKVDYDRNLGAVEKNGGFRSSMTIVDRIAVDDAGGDAKAITIQLRDTYGTAGVDSLKGQFLALAPTFTRPVRKTTRTIDSRFFEGIGVGRTVRFTDAFARDPDTGVRGVTTRAAIITRHRWTLGGAIANSDQSADVSGEVDVMLQDAIRVAPYVPAAQLDETAPSSGYVIGTKVATCHAHKFSESSDVADATRMLVGYRVRWLQIDPANPAATSTHDDIVAAQSGNTVTMTTGFAGYNSALRYLLVFDSYSDSTAAQQGGFAYQADDADGKIADARVPFQYVSVDLNLPLSYTSNSPSDPVALPGDNTYGDGVGFDIGTEVQVQRLINNLLDYKLAHCMPYLQTAVAGAAVVMSGTVGVDYTLVDIRPINLTGDELSVSVSRALSVAPFFRSETGTVETVRVSLVAQPPSGTTVENVDRGAVYAEAVFTTPATTTWGTATPQNLNIGRVKNRGGTAYLLIECSGSATGNAQCRGLGKCQEGPRL